MSATSEPPLLADHLDDELALFPDPEDPGDDDLDPRVNWASCRHCHVLSTAAGIDRHQHGEGSRTCAMYIARYGL